MTNFMTGVIGGIGIIGVSEVNFGVHFVNLAGPALIYF